MLHHAGSKLLRMPRVFPDRAAYLAWSAQLSKPGSGEQVVADELKFLDRSRTRAYVVEECVTSG